MKKKKQHEWYFMGNDTKGRGDLSRCELCGKWRWSDGRLFKMKSEEWQRMFDVKEIVGF